MSTPADHAAELRDQLLQEERWLLESDLPEDLEAHELLSAEFRGRKMFPGFQFLAGIPNPRIRDLMAQLPRDGRGWVAVLWCFAPTKRLGGARRPPAFSSGLLWSPRLG